MSDRRRDGQAAVKGAASARAELDGIHDRHDQGSIKIRGVTVADIDG